MLTIRTGLKFCCLVKGEMASNKALNTQNDRAQESADQTTYISRLILLYSLHKLNSWSQRAI